MLLLRGVYVLCSLDYGFQTSQCILFKTRLLQVQLFLEYHFHILLSMFILFAVLMAIHDSLETNGSITQYSTFKANPWKANLWVTQTLKFSIFGVDVRKYAVF